LTRWTELNRRAVAFYQEQAASRPRYSAEWNWLTLESLYHQLRLDEDEGILHFAALFEKAKNVSRYDFCSELLNNIQDVPLTRSYNQHWLTFYGGVIERVLDTFAWDKARAIDQNLYEQPDLPPTLRARVTTDLGRYYYQISDEYERAIAMLNESLTLRQELNDEQGQAYVLSHLAVAHSAAGNFDAGRDRGLACIQLAQQLNAPYRLGWGYSSLGVVESRAGDHATALNYFHQSLEAFETAGYEFGLGVVHYRIGRVSLIKDDLNAALEHFLLNIQLMKKYDKLVLVARTMVDICEIYLVQRDWERLAMLASEAEQLVTEQGNQAQIARLRLVQAEMVLRTETVLDESTLVETVANYYLDALLAAAQASRPRLLPIVEQIESHLVQLTDQDRESVAQALVHALATGVNQALEGALAQRGQLVVLPTQAHRSLQALKLADRWAST
jgi:tetratricopeptide (TPR) repeat protein